MRELLADGLADGRIGGEVRDVAVVGFKPFLFFDGVEDGGGVRSGERRVIADDVLSGDRGAVGQWDADVRFESFHVVEHDADLRMRHKSAPTRR